MSVAAAVAIVAGRCWGGKADAPSGPPSSVDQELKYLWPTVVWNSQLLSPGDASDAAVSSGLAEMGERGFDNYVNKVLPRELEADTDFAREFADADGSRLNLGFLRWQKRVYHEVSRVGVEEIQWDGKPIPRLPGIPYKWRRLYESQEFRAITAKVGNAATAMLNQLEDARQRRKFRIFAWAEVYRPGDFQRSHTHTGAALAGTLFARHASGPGGGQELIIEDSRGPSPPFGQAHAHQPVEGELVMWPAWAPHYLSPNPGNTTNVYFNFLLWPPGGVYEFDWEDDITGDYTVSQTVHVGTEPAGTGADVDRKPATDEL